MNPSKLLIVVILASIFATAAARQPATQPTTQPADRVTVYAAIVKPGPTWRTNLAAGKRNDMTRHFEYTKIMRSEGKLLFGGPFADGTGGLLVYRAQTIDLARQFMNADPATIDGVFEYDLHPWLLNAADLPRR